MSDTPRTDAKTQFFGWNPEEGEEFVTASFARELERENAVLRAESKQTQIGQHAEIKNYAAKIAELERQNAALRDALIIEEERSIYWRDNEGKAMAYNAALRADRERLLDILQRWLRMADEWYAEADQYGFGEPNITAGMINDTRAALVIAAKEAQP